MVSLDDAVTARYTAHGQTFEILVDPGLVEKVRAGKATEVADLLAIDAVFTNSREGEHASDEDLQKVFGTTNVEEVANKIVLDGEIQLTTEQRRRMQEDKEKQVVSAIVRLAWNPQTKSPHPPVRIERALEEAKFRVDPFRPLETQVEEAIQALKPLLPISMDEIQVAFKIPPNHTGHAYGRVRGLGTLVKESWEADGSLIGVLRIPAGRQGEVFDELNAITKGEVETKVLK